MKQKVIEILKNTIKEIGANENLDFDKLIETPKDFTNGDFAFPCFILAKELKDAPHKIAIKLREEIGNAPEEFSEIEVAGPYLNFYLDRKALTKNLIEEIKIKKDDFGKNDTGKGKSVMIEFASPNTNKPLHLGHLRNMALGESNSKIYEANGFKVVKSSINNDRGIHICKSMLAYKKFGEGTTPESVGKKSDHFVGDYYVKYNDEFKKDSSLEQEAQEMLKKWEEGDKEVVELWKKMNKWAFDGFSETYKKFGVSFDKEYYESEIYKFGKEIILDGLEKGIFTKREDGAVVINLDEEKLGEKVLLRSDGTAIYITQDIYLAKLKFDEFNIDESMYVVGNEQEYHFQVLFSILDKLGICDKDKLAHISYGMVNLPEGRMKSREGTVVDADNLIQELQEIVVEGMKERGNFKEEDSEKESLKLALAAIKYFLLKVDSKKGMVFNPKESISFEGDTGPYLQYSYARASSILRKAVDVKEFTMPEELEEKEVELTLKLNEFKQVVFDAYRQKNPALIANYAYKTSQIFNEFYHSCKVIGSQEESFRLNLIDSFRQVLKNALALLGIEVMEEM